MNGTQIRGILDRLVIVGLTWASTKGYVTPSQVAEYAPLIVGIIAVVLGYWFNTDTSLVQKAAAVPGTTVVTTPEIAAATPNEANVVANTETAANINATVKENK